MKPDHTKNLYQSDPQLERLLDQALGAPTPPPGLVANVTEKVLAAQAKAQSQATQRRRWWLSPMSGLAAAVAMVACAGLTSLFWFSANNQPAQPSYNHAARQVQLAAAHELAVLAQYQPATAIDTEIQRLSAQLESAMNHSIWDVDWTLEAEPQGVFDSAF